KSVVLRQVANWIPACFRLVCGTIWCEERKCFDRNRCKRKIMKAKKSFGQHFLVQDAIAAQLADALQTEGCAAIVEVGPGKGILTAQLLRQPLPVIAVELDRDLIPILEKRFAGTGLTIVQGDILRTHYSQHIPDEAPYVLTGNFPYNISSQIVFLCLDQR